MNTSFSHLRLGEPPRILFPQTIPQSSYAMPETKNTRPYPFQNYAVAAPSVNLPTYGETDVSLWFLTVENVFRRKGIVDENQKYEFLLVALDLRHLQRIKHVPVLANLSPTCPFSQVRKHC